jgi:hypothetical protein
MLDAAEDMYEARVIAPRSAIPSVMAPGYESYALIGVPAGVPPLPLPFRQRGDELAAEGRDVRDDAAPD